MLLLLLPLCRRRRTAAQGPALFRCSGFVILAVKEEEFKDEVAAADAASPPATD